MIDEKEAKKQLSRFSGLRGFTDLTPEALKDYVCAFQIATSRETAGACAESILGTATSETRIPSATEIRRWIYERQEAEKPPREERLNQGPHCAKCQGFGIKESTRAEDLNSTASYCDCEAGRRRSNWEKDNESPERVNAARRKLLALKTSVPVNTRADGRVNRLAHCGEIYNGEF